MKCFYWALASLIGVLFYVAPYQEKNNGIINHEEVSTLSKDQMEAIYSQLSLCKDNKIISKKDFKSLSKKKQKIILVWLTRNSKYQPCYTQSLN